MPMAPLGRVGGYRRIRERMTHEERPIAVAPASVERLEERRNTGNDFPRMEGRMRGVKKEGKRKSQQGVESWSWSPYKKPGQVTTTI